MSAYVPPPPYVPQDQPLYSSAATYARPWSGMAIAAFVLSLLGFLGFTAVLGLILGIAGIMVTRGGKRRGMGLAVAAIPISIVTGAIGVMIVLGATWVYRGLTEVPRKLVPILSSRQGDPTAISELRSLASPKLNEALSDQEIESWLAKVREKHGTLAKLTFDPQAGPPKTVGGKQPLVFPFAGQFVNGTATVQVAFETPDELLQRKVSDIDVSGLSLRESAGEPSAGAAKDQPAP